MKPVKVVAQVAYVLSLQDMAKVARAVSSPHGDERNPCLKLRQGPLSERVARKGVRCWLSVVVGELTTCVQAHVRNEDN